MNENNLENANLDDEVTTESDTTVSEDTVSEVSTDAGENDAGNDTNEVSDVEVVEDTTEPTADEPANVTVLPVTTRTGAGRKVDTTGKTALGKARLLYAENSTLTPKQLKQLFETALPAAGFANVTPAVCQTYASLVRKKKAA